MQETQTTSRPEFVKDEHLQFLDDLRESGETNMFGAAGYLDAAFGFSGSRFHSSQMARDILGYWMQSFGKADR